VISEGSRIVGVRAQDSNGGGSLEIRARVTVNATGVLTKHLGTPGPRSPILKAMNLVTSRPAGAAALGGRSASGRNLFLVPWRGRALFGTWESPNAVPYEDYAHAERSEVDGFIEEVNQAFPSVNLKLGDVTLVHRGLVAGVAASYGQIRLERHDQVEDLTTAGLDGVFTVVGAKYTTARAVAERVVDRVLVKLGRPAVPCRTALDQLPDVFGQLEGDEALVRAVRDEMAITLRDAVIRRTPLGALACPSDAALSHAAQVVGRELGWVEPRKGAEIQAVRSFYDIGSGFSRNYGTSNA
jgi:glycerol-3-phosphate dehydrogenase